MSESESSRQRYEIRSDGWTPERQLRFLDALAQTRSVARAAACAGMSRESAYRLRDRKDGALFAVLWDRAIAFQPRLPQVHIDLLRDGQLTRLLGTHFRLGRRGFLEMRSGPTRR